VPRNLTRYYGSGDLHFLTASCYRRQPLLGTAGQRDLFLDVLERVRRRYRLVVLGYVVMPEHFHLLLTEPQRANLSIAIQALKLGFVRDGCAPGAKPPEIGHIWQARFYDFNVWTERKRIEKLRYVHRNPVKRGLVESPEQWRWSSFCFYMFGEVGRVRVNETDNLVMPIRSTVS